MIGLWNYLIVGALVFVIGVMGIFLNRKNVIIMLMSIELILLSVSINFVTIGQRQTPNAATIIQQNVLDPRREAVFAPQGFDLGADTLHHRHQTNRADMGFAARHDFLRRTGLDELGQ